jgi:hypothetical protein
MTSICLSIARDGIRSVIHCWPRAPHGAGLCCFLSKSSTPDPDDSVPCQPLETAKTHRLCTYQSARPRTSASLSFRFDPQKQIGSFELIRKETGDQHRYAMESTHEIVQNAALEAKGGVHLSFSERCHRVSIQVSRPDHFV